MKKQFSSFLAGVLTAALLVSLTVSALAASGSFTISVDHINIQVNGQTFTPKDATGADVPVFAYNGTTYAPLRALAEAYGLEVGYDAVTKMASVGAKGTLPAPITDPVVTPAPTPTPDLNEYVFSMTDTEIQQAITDGAVPLLDLQKNHLDKFILTPLKYNIQTPGSQVVYELLAEKSQITLLTPYVYMARMSCVSTSNFESYSFDAAKKYYSTAEKIQAITISAVVAELIHSNGASFSIGVMQDGKVIPNAAISGLDGFPDHSSDWPDTPAYERLVTLTFNQSAIDVNRPIQFIVRYVGSDEIIYEINLQNY